MKKFLVIGLAALSLLACKQDPYGGKEVNDVPPKPKSKPEPLPGADSLQIEKMMLFVENQQGIFAIKASVKGVGAPVIQFQGLPSGVSYDPATMKLSWTPDYAAGNDPTNPNILMRDYRVKVSLFSSDDPATERLADEITLRVADMARPASVRPPLDMTVSEGQQLVHRVTFEDQEYPNGPFEIAQSGLPGDAILEWPDKRVPAFTFRFNPGYDRVINKQVEDFIGHVVIFNPRGKRLDFNIHWTLRNETVAPQTAGPKNIAQPGDVDFVVIAEDMNGEAAPVWDKVTTPAYGMLNVTSTPITGPGHPKSTGVVSWKAIPKDKLGIPVKITLRACMPSGFPCTNHDVTVLPMVSVLSQGARK